MQQPTQFESDNIYEVRFKNTRKAFFRNVNALPLITGDFVVVESDRGYDVGQISLGGILARLQMRKRKVRADSDRVRKIYRRALREDLDKLQKAREREQETLVRTREIVRILDLDMKLSDVEFQGDNTKAIFYYIADTRVDFRELIKRLANEFRIRVEMKQIGLRHESALVGGIGSCGRELCCATWLTDFKTVSTAAARYQNLSLNPMKISGQCGRLKCCLNYELDSYMDALKDIPKVERLETEMGMAYLQKTDIFKRVMWFSYQGETTWIALSTDKVRQLWEMNQEGIKPASLHVLDGSPVEDIDKPMDFVDVVGQSVLREDPKRKKKKKKGKDANTQGRGNNYQTRTNEGESTGAPGAEGGASPARQREGRREGGNPQNRRDQRRNDGQQRRRDQRSEGNPQQRQEGGEGEGGNTPRQQEQRRNEGGKNREQRGEGNRNQPRNNRGKGPNRQNNNPGEGQNRPNNPENGEEGQNRSNNPGERKPRSEGGGDSRQNKRPPRPPRSEDTPPTA